MHAVARGCTVVGQSTTRRKHVQRTKLKVGGRYYLKTAGKWRYESGYDDFDSAEIEVLSTANYDRSWGRGEGITGTLASWGRYVQVKMIKTGRIDYVLPANIMGPYAEIRDQQRARKKASDDRDTERRRFQDERLAVSQDLKTAVELAGLPHVSVRIEAGSDVSLRLTLAEARDLTKLLVKGEAK